MNDTKTLQAPSGRELVLRTWLSAGEARELRLVYVKHAKVNLTPKQEHDKKAGEIKDASPVEDVDLAGAIRETEDILVSSLVVSYDGSSDDVLGRLLKAPPGDHEFALEQAKEIQQNPTQPKTPDAGGSSSAQGKAA